MVKVQLKRKQTRRKRSTSKTKPRRSPRLHPQKGGALDIQNLLSKTGVEFHWPGYQYMGPGTHLKKRLARGDPGINRLDKLAKQHDIDYSHSKNLRDKWKADRKMIKGIEKFKTNNWTESVVKNIMKAKVKLKL